MTVASKVESDQHGGGRGGDDDGVPGDPCVWVWRVGARGRLWPCWQGSS